MKPPAWWTGPKVRDKGLNLRKTYLTAAPFPHIAINDSLPEAVLDRCLAEFPTDTAAVVDTFNRNQERFKRSFTPDLLQPFSRHLFYAFNSWPFIQVLENISGIRGLIPDPYFEGAATTRSPRAVICPSMSTSIITA